MYQGYEGMMTHGIRQGYNSFSEETKDTHVLRVKQCLRKNEAFMRMYVGAW